MTRPVRLQLSRKKGFDLQAQSHALNGLPAVMVARPTKWGNPFKVGNPYPAAEEAVRNFDGMLRKHRWWIPVPMPWPPGKVPTCKPTTLEDVQSELHAKNLACWCALDAPCHADVLLELANAEVPE
jgi:hypothetical protein